MTATVTTRWWWVRHAPVDNPERRLYGHDPVRANVSDRDRFAALSRALPDGALWLVTSLVRTRDTAEALAAAMVAAGRRPPNLDRAEAGLAEQDFGAWTGLPQAELQRRYPNARTWIAPAHERPEGGESFADLMTRVAEAVDRLTVDHAGRDIVAVAHGGTIRAALGQALGLTPDTALRFHVHNLSLTRIDHVRPPAATGAASAPLWRVVAANLQPAELLRSL